MWDLRSRTRDRTHTPCTGRWTPSPWTAREDPACMSYTLASRTLILAWATLWKCFVDFKTQYRSVSCDFISFKNIFIARYVRYNIVLVSATCQHESATDIHMSPPSWTSIPSPTPSQPSRLSQSARLSSLSHPADFHWVSIPHMVMYVSMLLSPFIPPSLSHSVSTAFPLLPCK